VEVTPLTNRAFRSSRGLTGGLAFLLLGALATMGLTACGAPSYTYVADSAAKAYYKVPTQWHQISQKDLDAALKAGGLTADWSTAFDASTAPSGSNFLAPTLDNPFVFAEVLTPTPAGSAEISYNLLRDFLLPVTSNARQQYAAGGFPLTNFQQLRDQTISAPQGVHGVRETFQYTFPGGVTDTFDEDVLTNADQTIVYFLMIHCTDRCYSQDQNNINTVMSSFTVGSPT
jgi:hypothetical protein